MTAMVLIVAAWVALDFALVGASYAWGRRTANRRVRRALVAGTSVRLTSTPHRQANR